MGKGNVEGEWEGRMDKIMGMDTEEREWGERLDSENVEGES